jgi:ParB-like chromosome segregation protein Spo0J
MQAEIKKKALHYKKTTDLIPYINNSRTHSEEQILQIAASIKEFGFTNPVLLDSDNGIIAGHGRAQAALKLNLDKIPCIILEGLTEAQKKAYVIADNKLALNAAWDFEILKSELEFLQEIDFDISLAGFENFEVDDLFKEIEDQDKVDEFKEIDEYQLDHTCPKCGFEYND